MKAGGRKGGRAAALASFWLKTSRPGLYFQWLWLYLLPLAHTGVEATFDFWVGLVWVTLPLSLLVYGWNDLVDSELDRSNPRKDSFLFGARGSVAERQTLPAAIVVSNLPFALYFVVHRGLEMALLFVAIVVVNTLYNHPRHGLRGKPPLELFNELGVLLIVAVSAVLNALPGPGWQAYAYLYLFVVHAHLIGEVMDLDPDRRGGRRTVAVVLGRVWTKIAITALVAVETVWVLVFFEDLVLAAILGGGLIWLLLDLTVIYRDREYSLTDMKRCGLAMNAVGYASMAWVWIAGTFTADGGALTVDETFTLLKSILQ